MTTDVAQASIPVPEPDLTGAELIARADALRQLLLDEQAATEGRGYYSERIFEEFRKAGFYRTLQPRRFGGYEFDVPTFARLIMAVSRGCPSSGWCLCRGLVGGEERGAHAALLPRRRDGADAARCPVRPGDGVARPRVARHPALVSAHAGCRLFTDA